MDIINNDISLANTLKGDFYSSEDNFEYSKENIFAKSWQLISDDSQLVYEPQSVYPFILLDGFLTEPMLLTKDKEGSINCLTNVCTHRGNVVALKSGHSKKLTCSYHGRRFNLQGKFEFMPEFNDAENFPRPCDNLHTFPIKKWGDFLFAGLNPSFDFHSLINVMEERIGFLPIELLSLIKILRIFNAHWAFYCDNYLEGFHVPFVHEGLNEVLIMVL